VHGANRLASTSLLEGLVWGRRAAEDIIESGTLPEVDPDQVPPWEPGVSEEADPALIWRDIRTIQYTMWHYVGLIRSVVRLNRALSDLYHLNEEIEEFYKTTRLSDELIGLRHSIRAALVVATAAKLNRTSIGCHYLEDGKQAGVL
jgi:L-aspartate oxidase